jgi:phospholipid/cholesterol/gamma-HCH transport system permease protein
MSASSLPEWRLEQRDSEALLTLSGSWLVHESGLRSVEELRSVTCQISGCARLRFATENLDHWDSALVAFIRSVETSIETQDPVPEVDPSGLPEALRRLLALAHAEHDQHFVDHPAEKRAIVGNVGMWVLRGWTRLTDLAALLGEIVLRIVPPFRRRGGMQRNDVIAQMQASGINALGIVAVVNSLVGAILAFVGAVQLQRFGAGGYTADLVGVAVVREMAPIMTAIVMAGRTGGAYAAEIAMMQGNEEIDALQVSGISPFDYLVLPRVVALVAMLPLLYIYACFVGIAGGFVVAYATLGLSPTAFFVQLQSSLPSSEFYLGLTKSLCFGGFIALVSCLIGLHAGRSATDVGDAATRAVVIGIVGIISLDAIFAACANVLGI